MFLWHCFRTWSKWNIVGNLGVFTRLASVLVSKSCRNKLPETGWLKTIGIYLFFHSSGDGKFKTIVSLGNAPSEDSRGDFFCFFLAPAVFQRSLAHSYITPISASLFHMAPSLCLCVFSPLIKVPVIEFRAHSKSRILSSWDP